MKKVLLLLLSISMILFMRVGSVSASHTGIEFFFDEGNHFIAGESVNVRLKTDFTVGAALSIQLVRLDTSEVKDTQTFIVPAAVSGFSTIKYEYTAPDSDFFPFHLIAAELDTTSKTAFIAPLPPSIASFGGGFDSLAVDTLYIVDSKPDFELRLNDYTFKQGEYIVVWHRLQTIAEAASPDIVEHVSAGDRRYELRLYDVAFNSSSVVFPITKPPEAKDNPSYTLLVPAFEGVSSLPFTSNTHALPNSGLFVIGLDRNDQDIDRFIGVSGTMAARAPDTQNNIDVGGWTNELSTWSVDGSGEASPTVAAPSGPYTFVAVTTLDDGAPSNSRKTFNASINIDTATNLGSTGIVAAWIDNDNHWRFIITWNATPEDATYSIGSYTAGVLSEVASGNLDLAVDDVVNLSVSMDKNGNSGDWTIIALKGDQDPSPDDNVTSTEPLFEKTFSDNTHIAASDDWGLIATSSVDAANVLNKAVEYITFTAEPPNAPTATEEHSSVFIDIYGDENPVIAISRSGKSFGLATEGGAVALDTEHRVTLTHADAKIFTSFNSKLVQDTGTAFSQSLAYSHQDSRTLKLGTVVCCSDDDQTVSLELASTRINSRTGEDYTWILAIKYRIEQERSVAGALSRISGSFGMGDTPGHIAFAFALTLLVSILMLHFSLTGSIIAAAAMWISLVVIGYIPPWSLMFLVLVAGILNVTGLLSREV